MSTIRDLQQKIGVDPDGTFGPKTAKAFARHFNLDVPQAAHFLGQCHHESMGFKSLEENLTYSTVRLLAVFPKHFTVETADNYQMQPQRIANRVYANRMGNGNEASGDGWRYRGRGPLQLTFKNNYQALATHLSNPEILSNPDLVAKDFGFESALWFFRQNRIFQYAGIVNTTSITMVSRAVNLGNPHSTATPHGMPDRIAQTNKYYQMLLL